MFIIPTAPHVMGEMRDADAESSFRKQSVRDARILVVDDAQSCREVFSTALVRVGHRVETAGNGADALHRIASGNFDLLITDWEMPVLDGARLVLAVRSAGLSLPIVMLSGRFAETELPRVVDREVFATLEKPVCVFSLLEAVDSALRLNRS